jgi:uncharacterized protein
MRTVKIRDLIWDDFNISHIAKHGVGIEDVEVALGDKKLKFLEAKNARFFVLGRVGKRLLSVVLAKEENNKYYVVTARDMSKPERRFYRSGQN